MSGCEHYIHRIPSSISQRPFTCAHRVGEWTRRAAHNEETCRAVRNRSISPCISIFFKPTTSKRKFE